MPRIRLEQSTTRAELRAANELIAHGEAQTITLSLASSLKATSPVQFSAWMQLVLHWGQDVDGRILELDADTATRIDQGLPPSDIEVFAVLLAVRVFVGERDVTSRVQAPVRSALSDRNVLVNHDDGATSSLLLAAHTFTNRTSPQLHALWQGELGVEETARTLYHDVWPSWESKGVVRDALREFGEEAVPVDAPTHVTRTAGPSDAMGRFENLGLRAPRQRGLALELATETRVQPKPLHDEVGEILFELVQNTEWHATRAGGSTGANCRMLTFREYDYSPQQLPELAHFDPMFAAYARAAITRVEGRTRRPVTRITFGSVTVIDSGIGLARSAALSLDQEHLLTEETEVKYLIAALSKNLKRTRANLGNIGLARVQQSLNNLAGFMSIRTGSVAIHRDFVSNPFEPISESARKAPPALLLDWVPPRAEDLVVGPQRGTAVVIAYPVEIEVAS